MFTFRGISAFHILKITTLVLLAGLLVFLGSATQSTSPFAYFVLSRIVMLEIIANGG